MKKNWIASIAAPLLAGAAITQAAADSFQVYQYVAYGFQSEQLQYRQTKPAGWNEGRSLAGRAQRRLERH